MFKLKNTGAMQISSVVCLLDERIIRVNLVDENGTNQTINLKNRVLSDDLMADIRAEIVSSGNFEEVEVPDPPVEEVEGDDVPVKDEVPVISIAGEVVEKNDPRRKKETDVEIEPEPSPE